MKQTGQKHRNHSTLFFRSVIDEKRCTKNCFENPITPPYFQHHAGASKHKQQIQFLRKMLKPQIFRQNGHSEAVPRLAI